MVLTQGWFVGLKHIESKFMKVNVSVARSPAWKRALELDSVTSDAVLGATWERGDWGSETAAQRRGDLFVKRTKAVQKCFSLETLRRALSAWRDFLKANSNSPVFSMSKAM